MHQARQAFDVRAPFIVASEELVCGDRRLRRGETFSWRDLGVSEFDLLQLWTAFKVDVAPGGAPEVVELEVVELDDETLDRLTAPSVPAQFESPAAARKKRR